MTSRLTASAALFAVLAAASIAFAADLGLEAQAPAGAAAQAPVVQLERVVVTAKRLADESR